MEEIQDMELEGARQYLLNSRRREIVKIMAGKYR